MPDRTAAKSLTLEKSDRDEQEHFKKPLLQKPLHTTPLFARRPDQSSEHFQDVPFNAPSVLQH